MKKNQTFYLLLFTLICTTAHAQKNSSLFKAGVTAGVNFTQIDGDEQFGYNQRSFNFGLKGAIILRKDFDLSTELIYSQRGTQPDAQEKIKNIRTAYLTLRYAEVPILFNYFLDRSDIGHYRWNLYAGFSYGRLLKSQTSIFKGLYSDTVQQNLVNAIGYNSSDFSFIIGAKRYFTSRIALSVRHTFSLNYLYKNPAPIVVTRGSVLNRDYKSFRSFFLSVNLYYDFISPKLAKPRKGKTAPKSKKLI